MRVVRYACTYELVYERTSCNLKVEHVYSCTPADDVCMCGGSTQMHSRRWDKESEFLRYKMLLFS